MSQAGQIILVAFGAASEASHAVYAHVENAFRARYPAHDFRWAYTSRFVARKLQSEGAEVSSLEMVAASLREKPRPVVFQSLHIAPGAEFHRARELVDALGLPMGKPLLSVKKDQDALVDAVEEMLHPTWTNLAVIHGNEKVAAYAAPFQALAQALEERYPHLVAQSLEGAPGDERLDEVRVRAQASGGVHFIPLMLSKGKHVLEDVLGEKPESWKSIVAAPAESCAPTLGKNAKALEIFFRHLDDVLA
jgi:sirohydrochlorin cobaltochelatase